jgi:DNA polymerase-1
MFGHRQVICVDTEFGTAPSGEILPVCLVAVDFYSGNEWRIWEDELLSLKKMPFDTSEETLFVAFSAAAELGVLLKLGVSLPRHILDLFLEYRALRNGRRAKIGKDSMLEALAVYGVASVDAGEKKEMQALAMRGGPWSSTEPTLLMDYCRSDVDGLLALLPKMEPELTRLFHPDEMLFRGRSATALARSYRTGIPLDVETLTEIDEQRGPIRVAVAAASEATHHWGIYNAEGGFSHAAYTKWVERHEIPLPLTATGHYTTKDEELEKLETGYPMLGPLRSCRNILKVLERFTLTVDADGRSRPYANQRGSITGRNQPPGFIFSLPRAFRPLIKPPGGYGVAYLDARAQEWLIAAVKSEDARMLADYRAGDVHMGLAIALKFAPTDATKESHPDARKKAKAINYGILYGKTKYGLANDLNISEAEADDYLRQCAETWPKFFRWRQSMVNGAMREDQTYFTDLGWPFWTGHLQRKRLKGEPGRDFKTMLNFPMQAAGCDWMTAGLIAATESAIEVCCSVHDGYLIIAPLERLNADIMRMTAIMCETSIRLFGEPMIIDCEAVVRWPDRFPAETGRVADMWELIQRELVAVRRRKQAAGHDAA